MWNDRVTPIGTMGQEFLLKVYGKRSYHGLSGTQVLMSWALSSKEWSEEPIIKVKDKKLRQQLGIEGKYASMHDFFDADNHYKLSEMAPTRAVQEVDEKMGLIFMLLQGTLIHPVPAGVKSLSDTQVSIELFYNRINWTLWSMIGCFVFALFSFVFRKYWWHKLPILLLLAFLLASFFLRWYIAGRLPLSNGYETMIFLAICLVTGTYLVHIVAYVPVLCAGFMLLVAHLGEMNPQITQLMPVLHSPWLSIHVSVIMMSYALLILSFMERRLLEPAVFLLAAGIFLGAVWANVSWGTYWSWDPKESWALITLIVYSLPLHTQSLPWFRSTRNYRIYSILALCSLLMTYFGVNYLLGGMHSYAG
jgi:ABC-type transport system involved in cytochrome c biogenesis permease subunit